MRLWPDLVFQLLPGLGLVSGCSALAFLVAMRRTKKDKDPGGGFMGAIYALRIMDLLLGVSLFYAGFYGIHLSVQYGSEQDARQMPPFQCMFTALHLHIWVFTDAAQLLLLALLCTDQCVSVAWTKRHKEFSSCYFHPACLALAVLVSGAVLGPAWAPAMLAADNSTIQISAFCAAPETFGQEFYGTALAVRKWAPLAEIAALCLVAMAVLLLQLLQRSRFKWSDNNRQSAKFLLLVLCRALWLALAIHVPLIIFDQNRPPDQPPQARREFDQIRAHAQEIAIRAAQAALVGIFQPIADALLLDKFVAKIGEFFKLTGMKRTWQSADDPPAPHRSIATSGWDIFGSFHSTAGNIMGEAGIPMELNADVQRSVSFYYKDDE